MKSNTNPNQSETRRSLVCRALAEPFLVIGMATFWALALPVAAIVFGLNLLVEQVAAYLTPVHPAAHSTRARMA
jgi:hypothetical protein